MIASWKFACLGAALLCASAMPATAQRIVGPGITTFYFSGTRFLVYSKGGLGDLAVVFGFE